MPQDVGTRRVYVRAMNRSLARLRDAHRDEYERYLEEELRNAREEADHHIAQSVVEHPGEQVPPQAGPGGRVTAKSPVPPTIKPGPKKVQDNPVVTSLGREIAVPREDVARCPYCVRYHDRGHECSSCGRPAPGSRRETVPNLRSVSARP